jgi:F-type H+-transporting ATPase subunit b
MLLTLLLAAPEESQPLVDLDSTVFIQLAIFIVLLAVLNALVFKPFLRSRAERDDRIGGEKRRAQEMTDSAEHKLADVQARLHAAKTAGVAARNQAREQAGQRERDIMAKARTESQQRLDEQRAAMQKSGDAARAKLRESAGSWARQLAGRILGREVA